MDGKEVRKTLVKCMRRAVRFYIKEWPNRRTSLELVLISLLAEVSKCRETDLIEAVDQFRLEV